ncbi:MAG: poly-beta-1,6-N-acetyl-D-glucosamine N-deacetylase PgaB [Nitrospirota bacterium]
MHRLQIFIPFIIFLLFSCSAPMQQTIDTAQSPSPHPSPQRGEGDLTKPDKKVIAAQVLLFKSSTYEELKKEMAAMKASGVNIVIVRVFHNKGDRYHGFASLSKHQSGVYFKSSIAPVIDDVLTRIIDIGHRQGLLVYAWMTTRRMDWKWSDTPKWRDSAYDLKTKDFTYSKGGLDLFNQDFQDYLISVYREIAASGVDGILIQDDLVYRHTEGFSDAARLSYNNSFGFALRPENLYKDIYEKGGKHYVRNYTPLFWKWVEWRNQHIALFLDNLIREAKKPSPNLKIALNLYYETVINPKNGLAWFSQDISSLKNIDIDYFAVMAYHRQMMKEKRLNLDDALNMISDITRIGLDAIGNKDKLLMKVQSVDWDNREAVPSDELKKVFEAIKKAGGVSLAYVQNGNSVSPKNFLDKM